MINVTSYVQSVLHLQPYTQLIVFSALGQRTSNRAWCWLVCRHLGEQTFVDAGVKVNGQYYRDILLTRDLLPDIKQYSDYFIFQQDGAPAHRARETVELLKVETPDFIPSNLWPPNSPDLNPVDYKIWGILQERVYKTSSKDVDEIRHRIAEEWDKLDQRIIDEAMESGERDFKRVWLQVEDTLNTM